MLKEETLFGTVDKVQIAIDRLKHYEPPEGYYLAFSGGKDSIVIKRLAEMSGVKFDAHYSVTTIDPPDLIYYIREHHLDVHWERPEMPLLKMMVKRGYPSRRSRWCCESYKENGGDGRRVILGIRWEESHNRRMNHSIFRPCYGGGYKSKKKEFVNPIIDWTTTDVWDFIREQKLPYCKLYDEGWDRIGCLMCPMARRINRLQEAERYPRFVNRYIKAFEQLYEYRKDRPTFARWNNGKEIFDYWLNYEGQVQRG